MSTYDKASADDSASVAVYTWKAQISGAFLIPLHICEVALRNAVADALQSAHGPNWPWLSGFERSLPAPAKGYNPQSDLTHARKHQHTTAKVIPELKFAFWQDMFTKRHDERIWSTHLHRVLPNFRVEGAAAEHRQKIYADLEEIRRLRNRIAHHEPIFTRNLADDLSKITALIILRCSATAAWTMQNQGVTALLAVRPHLVG